MNFGAIIRRKDEGEKLWFAGGGVFTMKARARDTGGAFLLLEDDMVRGKVTPMHVHPAEDESIYVLEGELLVDVDGEKFAVGEGDFFCALRGCPHAFMVTSETARILVWQTPGTGEQFYDEASEPVLSEADAQRGPDFERLMAVAAKSTSIEIVGPPPFDRQLAELQA